MREKSFDKFNFLVKIALLVQKIGSPCLEKRLTQPVFNRNGIFHHIFDSVGFRNNQKISKKNCHKLQETVKTFSKFIIFHSKF